ncbi:MAG: hypothetical protein ABSH10_06610 [Phycisphaerae bacterium]|jgi:hypothetical protein
MKARSIVTAGAAAGLLACLGLAGCSYFAYLMAPEPAPKKVTAEFSDLKNTHVAIVIFTDDRTQYEYPYARLTLGSVIRGEMNEHLKGVTVTDPAKVCKYQDEHADWTSMGKAELAAALGVDYVLDITLVEYATREPGSIELFRGRITAQAALYRAGQSDSQGCAWRCDRLSVIYPKNNPIGVSADSDRQVRGAVEKEFADALVKKFYDHKEPVEE